MPLRPRYTYVQTVNDQVYKIVRAILGIALLILVSGIWACLWVPPPF